MFERFVFEPPTESRSKIVLQKDFVYPSLFAKPIAVTEDDGALWASSMDCGRQGDCTRLYLVGERGGSEGRSWA